MPDGSQRSRSRWLARLWPWAVLALSTFPAIWHFVHFETDRDVEFPSVDRPTFSARPPAAPRLAEPGDTIDRVGIYVSAGATVIAAIGWVLSLRSGSGHSLWPAALGLSMAAGWQASTPWPTLDGWHGLNWRVIFDPAAPGSIRLALAAGAVLILGWVGGWTLAARDRWPELWRAARRRGCLGLLAVSGLLVLARVFNTPDVEPFGYWPRWAFDWGMFAFGFALIRALPPSPGGWRRGLIFAGMVGSWWILVLGGIWMTWFHRPLERLRAVVPGKIYISAMPTRRGLEIAQSRHHFRTIINVFNEDTSQRSPLLPDELRFVREHGLNYYGSPNDPLQADAFLDKTLELAQDPRAWPILVHCHGCMDRSPAWMGIYRFVVQGYPLVEILREIEAHRGLRPKASVTLLYNRVLEPRAPKHYAEDPLAKLLNQCASGTVDPYYEQIRIATERRLKSSPAERLSSKDPATRRP